MQEVTTRGRRLQSRATALAVPAALGVALAVSACGGSSDSGPTQPANTTPATPTTTQPAVSGGTFRGRGFEVAVPAGWKREAITAAPNGTAAGIVYGPPTGARASIAIHVYTANVGSIDETLAGVLEGDKTQESAGALHDLRASVSRSQVPGARQAKLLRETYTIKGVQRHYANLVALTPSGSMITVEASAPADATGFDPANAVDSLRVTGG